MSFILRRLYRNIWVSVGKSDQERLAKIVLPRNVSYRTMYYTPEEKSEQTLSIYWPENCQSDLPVIFDVHGGGWVYGSKEVNRPFDMYLASLGFCVVGFSYRLAPEYKITDMMCDIDAAFRKAYEMRFDYPLDFNRVALTGDSAGGHLEGVFAAIQEDKRLQELFHLEKLPFTFKGINFNHAVSYLCDYGLVKDGSKMANRMAIKEMKLELFGRCLKKNEKEIYERTSSFDKLIAPLNSFPPAFVLTSSKDRFTHFSKRMVDDLTAKNFKVRYESYPDQKHDFNVMDINDKVSIKANKQIALFFQTACGD